MLDRILYYIILVAIFSLAAMPFVVSYVRTKDSEVALVVAILFDLSAIVAVYATYKLLKEKE